MRATQPVPLPLLAALAAVAVAAALFAIYVYPAQAQEGSAPDKPTGLEATASHGQVVLTWDDPEDDSITGYVILRRLPGVDPEGQFDELVADTGTAATTYTDSSVEAETRYTYRIKAINEHGVSERSRWSHIDTPAPPVPDKPKGLDATATHDSVTLTWDDPQDDSITGYVILRRVRVNDTGGDFSVLVANTESAATTYTDNEVAASTTYTYRIKAINEHGVSERSRWSHIDTPAPPEPPSNDPATGAPAITGTARVGETLTVDTSGIGDEDGLENAAFSYRWLADGTAISGATASAYTPVEADEGRAITVQVNFTDDAGNDETLTSAATAAVAAAPEPAANSPATGAPTITGTAQVGETLTVDRSSIGDEDGLENAAFSYRWLADGTAISGASANAYTPVEADEGKAITVQVNFTDDAGNDETLTSAATAAVAAAQPTEPPAQPTGLIATATHDSATLTWNDPQDNSITGYVILRRNRDTNAEGHFDEVVADTGTAATTYTDGSVAAETRYTYRIKVINQYGASERSRWYHIDTQAPPGAESGPADQAPANLTAVPADGQVVLSWDAPAEDADAVTGYQVLRAEGQGGLSTLVSDTGSTATTYTDAKVAAGYSYAYRIKAIRDGERSGASNEARVQLTPASPTGLTAETVAYNTVTLTWDEPDDDGITGYVVMRLDIVRSDMITLAADTGTADTGYTDETVDPETLYFYYLMAINSGGESELSNYAVAHTPEAPDPALFAPANLTVELVDGRVSLGWEAPAEDAGSVTGYEILRARGWDDPVVLVADTGSVATAYTDDSADAPGESYAYRVKAVRNGERSQASGEAVIQLPGPPPTAPGGLIASFGVGGVFLTWQAPVEDAATVTGYEVLRAQGEGELTILVGDTGNAATTYTDATAGGASERYAYRVRAIRGQERSADSNEARVQLPPAAPRRVVSAAASDLVLLSWADPGDDTITGYRILRRRAIADVASDFVTLAEDTGSAETAYADDTVENGRVYVYRVLAIGTGGLSEPSRDVRVSTFTPVAPRAPLTGARAHVFSQLLSNLGQDTSLSTTFPVGGAQFAQGFTTGSYGRGYNLEIVELNVAIEPPTPDDVSVELWSATSADPPLPDARVATLTHTTGIWSDKSNSFNAPANTTLKADTTYFVFLSNSGSDTSVGTGFQLALTDSTSADANIAPGWGLGQWTSRTRSPQGSWSTPSSSGLAKFVVGGSFVLNPDPPGQNVSEPDGGDCAATSATQCRVAVGGSVTGDLTTRNEGDAFAVDLVQGETYRIDLEGADTSQGTNTDPSLVVFDYDLPSADQIVASDEDSGQGKNSLVTFTPDTTKTTTFKFVAQETPSHSKTR